MSAAALSSKARAALDAICDTFAPGGDGLPSATELGVPEALLSLVERNPRAAERKQVGQLLGLWDTTAVHVVETREAEHDRLRTGLVRAGVGVHQHVFGIGLLVTLLVRAQRQRQPVLAYGLSDHYRQIFELTRLDEAVSIHDSESDALAAAGAA